MKNKLVYLFCLGLVLGCQSPETNQSRGNLIPSSSANGRVNDGQDDGQDDGHKDEKCIPLPDLELDQERFGERNINDGKKLKIAETEDLQLWKMDAVSVTASGFTYYLLKDIYENDYGKVLLLSRTSEMEFMAWVAAYDNSNRLIDFKMVFYDEYAEGWKHTVMVVKNNQIEISDYSYDPETDEDMLRSEVYCITETLHFRKTN